MWFELVGAMATDQLPGDVMVDILKRLPIKSVLCFKSVCKTWYTLFNDSVFVRAHLCATASMSEATNTLSLMVHTRDDASCNHVHRLQLQLPYFSPIVSNIILPFPEAFDCFDVVGSINGLICLSFSIYTTSIVLWNPAIKKHYRIPSPGFTLYPVERATIGFAYDSKNDDYKVIRVLYSKHFSAKMVSPRVEIYSLQTNSWRRISGQSLPWLCYQRTCNTIANGVPYWYSVELQEDGAIFRELILWFDVEDEVFRSHTLPCYHHSSEFRSRFGNIDEHPVVIIYGMRDEFAGNVNVWRLNNNRFPVDDEVSWTKIFSLSSIFGIQRVVGCWRNGEIMAENDNGGLFLFDPSPKRIEALPSHGSRGFVEVYPYMESLVLPNGGHQ